ncbi:MAG: ATP-binding protein [Sneathiella sp.]
MLTTTGFFVKMMTFILMVTLPVAIIAYWMVTQNLLAPEYAVLLTLTPVGPGILIYNRLLREVITLSKRMELLTEKPSSNEEDKYVGRSGLLPVNDLLVNMQQYRRVFQHMLKDADNQQEDASLLFDMLPDPVIALNKNRVISRCNQSAKSFFVTDDMQGDVTGYLRHPSLISGIDAALNGIVGNTLVEFELPGKVTRYIAVTIVNLEDENADDLRIILTLHDLTTAKKLDQMRVDFVANAGHELRTPLAILIGSIETLQGPAANDVEAQQRFLGMMHAQSSRMSRLIDDLLSLSQIEMNEHSKPSAKLEITSLLRGVADLIGAKAQELGKTLVLDIPEKNVFVVGEKDQIFQVFTNLVDNAVKYSGNHTSVIVSLSIVGREVLISVTDQGDGIPSEHLARLTERFYRVDQNRSRDVGGTGLGLAIVKHIVSRHRGRLDIKSVVGKGSTFKVGLPFMGAEAADFPNSNAL